MTSSALNRAVINSLDSRIEQFSIAYLRAYDRRAAAFAPENLFDLAKRRDSLLMCLAWAKRRLWTICMEVLQV